MGVVTILLLALLAGPVACSRGGGSGKPADGSAPAAQNDAQPTTGLEALEPDPDFSTTAPEPYAWVDGQRYIAHGMGGLGEFRVTNSFEAFQTNYEDGIRIFEVDLVFTSDGALVARHDWEPYMYSFLGQTVDDTTHVLTLEEFESMPIHQSNTPLTIDDIVTIMKAYPDAYIMTDTKSSDPAQVDKALSAIERAIGPDTVLAKRFIIQVYSEAMVYQVRERGAFDNLVLTLYQYEGTPEQGADLAAANGIRVLTLPDTMWTPEFTSLVVNKGLIPAVHTINDQATAEQMVGSGVGLLYTDFLDP